MIKGRVTQGANSSSRAKTVTGKLATCSLSLRISKLVVLPFLSRPLKKFQNFSSASLKLFVAWLLR